MCSSASMSIIDQVVTDFVGQNRAFSAFEISLEAKERGTPERHRDMKDHIHRCQPITDAMEFGNYTKTLTNVGTEDGQPLQAFIYHPNTYDVSQYKPLPRKGGSKPVSPDPVLAAAATTTGSDGPGDDDSHVLDHRHRLMVSARFMRGISANPGDIVHVFSENDGVSQCMYVTKDAPAGKLTNQKMVENVGDRIYLYTTLFNDAGMKGNKFTIEVSTYNGTTPAVKITVA